MCGLYLADIILLVAGPIALNNVGWKFFLVLIIPTALHIVFVFFMCPETKGRSLVSLGCFRCLCLYRLQRLSRLIPR